MAAVRRDFFLGRDTASNPDRRTRGARSGAWRLGTAALCSDGGGIFGVAALGNGGAACRRRDFWNRTLTRSSARWTAALMRTDQKEGKPTRVQAETKWTIGLEENLKQVGRNFAWIDIYFL